MAGIVGYRGWRVNAESRLEPPHWHDHESPWKPRGFAIAKCLNGHTAAGEHCRCGLYAHYAITHAIKKENPAILGAIVGWGSTVHHETGFRCGRARIIGLSVPRKSVLSTEIARQVADLYEVPFFPKPKELRKEAERWGETRRPARQKKGQPGTVSSMMRSLAVQYGLALESGLQTAGANSNHGVGSSHHHSLGPPRSPSPEWARGQRPLRVEMGVRPIPGGHVRVEVELDVWPKTQITATRDFATHDHVIYIEGVDPQHWTLKDFRSETESIEIPLIGGRSSQSAMKPGRTRIFITLQGDFDVRAAKTGIVTRELRALERVGVPQRAEQVRESPPMSPPHFSGPAEPLGW